MKKKNDTLIDQRAVPEYLLIQCIGSALWSNVNDNKKKKL